MKILKKLIYTVVAVYTIMQVSDGFMVLVKMVKEEIGEFVERRMR